MRHLIHVLAILVLIGACQAEEARLDEKNTGEKAAKAGAAGALGGLVFGVITRNPHKVRTAAATGAAAATVTAATGNLTPTKGDKQKDQWEEKLGPANAEALVHLVKRRHDEAKKCLDIAAKGEPDHILAAEWIRGVVARDAGDADGEKAAVTAIMTRDQDQQDAGKVKTKIDELYKKLGELRKEYGDK